MTARAFAWILLIGLAVAAIGGSGDSASGEAEKASTPAAADAAGAGSFRGKKILFVNSYHEGYEWSDGIETGVREVLDGTGVDLRFFRMDTKRDDSEEFGREAGRRAKAFLDDFKPDVLIAADDNAQKYLVVPYVKGTDLPVVFCGVNWDASMYGYPAPNVTGMIELDMIQELVRLLAWYARGDRIGFLAADVEVERKLGDLYGKRFFPGNLKTYYVNTFKDWKEQYVKAQEEVDVLINHNNAGIPDWDSAAAESFCIENTKIPTGSTAGWMARFNLLIAAEVPEEQGEYAARVALDILRGAKPADIPLVFNEKAKLTINMLVADRLGIVFDPALLETAEIIGLRTQE